MFQLAIGYQLRMEAETELAITLIGKGRHDTGCAIKKAASVMAASVEGTGSMVIPKGHLWRISVR